MDIACHLLGAAFHVQQIEQYVRMFLDAGCRHQCWIGYARVIAIDKYAGARNVFCKESRGPKVSILMGPGLKGMLIPIKRVQPMYKHKAVVEISFVPVHCRWRL